MLSLVWFCTFCFEAFYCRFFINFYDIMTEYVSSNWHWPFGYLSVCTAFTGSSFHDIASVSDLDEGC